MKIFVLLFCLIAATLAFSVDVDDSVRNGIYEAPIQDQNEELVGAESAYAGGYGGGPGGYGGYGGYGGNGGYGGGHRGGYPGAYPGNRGGNGRPIIIIK